MWPDRVSNPGLLTYESGALPTALRGPATRVRVSRFLYRNYLAIIIWRFLYRNYLAIIIWL